MANFHRSLFVSFFMANFHRNRNIFCGLMDSLICEKEISKELVKENKKSSHFFAAFFGIKNASTKYVWRKYKNSVKKRILVRRMIWL